MESKLEAAQKMATYMAQFLSGQEMDPSSAFGDAFVPTAGTTTSNEEDYCHQHLPPAVVQALEAGAFLSLVQHLQERSDVVANMDLMTLSGFCRNCLAKWMVLQARRLVDNDVVTDPATVQALNALGYDEAAQHVYGMHYSDWKKRYQKKATEAQMEAYQASEPIQAKHDKVLLAKRSTEAPATTIIPAASNAAQSAPATVASTSLLSNVCCQDVDEAKQTLPDAESTPVTANIPSTPTAILTAPISVAVVTVSDRAFQGVYDDLSGPSIVKTVQRLTLDNALVTFVPTRTVPDEKDQIAAALTALAHDGAHIILTTGGTGLGPRDVTPEATRSVLTTELPLLLQYITAECAQRYNPLASLTRGTAGLLETDKGDTAIVANLPGNPKAMNEILPLLWPLLVHAVEDLRAAS